MVVIVTVYREESILLFHGTLGSETRCDRQNSIVTQEQLALCFGSFLELRIRSTRNRAKLKMLLHTFLNELGAGKHMIIESEVTETTTFISDTYWEGLNMRRNVLMGRTAFSIFVFDV